MSCRCIRNLNTESSSTQGHDQLLDPQQFLGEVCLDDDNGDFAEDRVMTDVLVKARARVAQLSCPCPPMKL